MGQLVFQATSGGQTNLNGQNTASTFNLNVPLANGTLVSTGDTATVTNTMISGPISIANGGTNTSSTPTAGAVPYGTGTALAYTAVGTTGQVLTSAGSGTPVWAAAPTPTSVANLSGGAAGKIPYQTGSSTTAFTAVGTTGQVLTSNGTSAPTWTSIGGSAWNKIATIDASANAIATFTGLNAYSYDYYVLIVNALVTSSSTSLFFRLGYGSTPTYITSGYYAQGMELASGLPTYLSQAGGGSGEWYYNTKNTSNGVSTGIITFSGFLTGNSPSWFGQMSTSTTAPASNYTTAGGFLSTSGNQITAIFLELNSGSPASSGSYTLYGISQ
jgi:hypothetical protein